MIDINFACELNCDRNEELICQWKRRNPNYDGEKIMAESLETEKESYWETGQPKLTEAEFEMTHFLRQNKL